GREVPVDFSVSSHHRGYIRGARSMPSASRLSLALVIGSILILSSCTKQGNSLNTVNANDPDNVAIARSMYATLLAGDMAAAYALMADDITWIYYGGEGQIPF